MTVTLDDDLISLDFVLFPLLWSDYHSDNACFFICYGNKWPVLVGNATTSVLHIVVHSLGSTYLGVLYQLIYGNVHFIDLSAFLVCHIVDQK